MKRWLRIGKELGFRLLREDCRHCKGSGMCHSGQSAHYGISCASCQKAAIGEIRTHVVKCEPCNGRGIFVFAVPQGKELERATLEVLPRVGEKTSLIRVLVTDENRGDTIHTSDASSPKLLTDRKDNI